MNRSADPAPDPALDPWTRGAGCPQAEWHTDCPVREHDWTGWSDWAQGMARTHVQRKCQGCDRYLIWVPKAGVRASDAASSQAGISLADDRISPDAIRCPACGRVSAHPDDVARRYCGRCHASHDELARDRRWSLAWVTYDRRIRRGLSIRRAARQINVGISTLSRLEAGAPISAATFDRVIAWLDIDPGVFAYGRPGSSGLTAGRPTSSSGARQ